MPDPCLKSATRGPSGRRQPTCQKRQLCESLKSLCLGHSRSVCVTAQWLLMHGVLLSNPIRLEQVQPAGGHAYVVELDPISHYLWVSSDDTDAQQRSTGLVLEDGIPVGPAHSLHDTIRQRGNGLFSHWQKWLLFSARDGSDPRQNGRSYVFEARYFLVEPYGTVASVAVATLASLLAILAIVASKPAWNAIRIVLKHPATSEKLIRRGAAIALGLSALGFYSSFSGVPITVSLKAGSNSALRRTCVRGACGASVVVLMDTARQL